MSVDELEVLRKKARNVVICGVLISLATALIVFGIFEGSTAPFIAIVTGTIITFLCSAKPKRNFILAFKETYVLKTLTSVFSNLIYEPEVGLPESVIRNTGMMNMGDRYTSNDYIAGQYKKINVIQSDIHIEEKHERTDSNGHTTTYWVTIFKGKWMIFDFNKEFKANVQVCQKGFGNAKLYKRGSDAKYQKVMMEDQDFNNKFKIYAQNEHDAFYILTPSLMEKLKKVTGNVRGKLLFCFIDNRLHIGLQNNKDSFEHSIYTKINEEKVINEISQDIKLITNFVDELSLDNSLFRREV